MRREALSPAAGKPPGPLEEIAIATIYKALGAASVALAGLTIWVMAAVSTQARADGSSLWVILGAALAMLGIGLGFLALRHGIAGGRDPGELR